MGNNMKPKEWRLTALTDIWTGNAQGNSDRLIPTGLMGSIRWWFEVLVRGLGGHACDPTVDQVRCPDTEGRHCVVCELFGCTGWARKFRLMVLDETGQVIRNQIRADQTFILRFIPLRPICHEEWCLLDATLRLIADYGAIGGKTVLKPSDEWGIADLGEEDLQEQNGQVVVRGGRRGLPMQQRDTLLEVSGSPVHNLNEVKQLVSSLPPGTPVRVKIERSGRQRELEVWAGKRHHQDFGLIKVESRPRISLCTLEELKKYIKQMKWRSSIPSTYQENGRVFDYSWASLQNFWCVKGRYLAREAATKSTFNQVVGRKPDKSIKEQRGRRVIRWSDQLEDPKDEMSCWLAGRQQESKKVFSFKDPESARRTFGFVKPGLVDFKKMKDRLTEVWSGFKSDEEFQTGEQILKKLLP